MNNSEFHCALQLDKLNIFEVQYYTCGNNKSPYFATSAARFIRSKRDYTQCGQSQETVCKPFKNVYNFYKKWDTLHLKDLTEEQYSELKKDLSELLEKYNHIFSDKDICFDDIVILSKLKPKKVNK